MEKFSERDFLFADKTAIYRGVAWENHIELLEQEHSYQFNNATVRSYSGDKYLSVGVNCGVAKIEGIGEVLDDELPENQGKVKVVTTEVVVVVSVEVYKSCRNCSMKIIDSGSQFAVCTKCGSKVKLSKCGNSSIANVILEDADKKEYRVTMFDEVLSIALQYGEDAIGECDVQDQLLSLPPLSYTINHKDIVSSISQIN